MMKKTINITALFALCFLLAACGGDNHSKYIGYYKYKSGFDRSLSLLEIKKDGDNFFLVRGSKTKPLEKSPDGLKSSNGPFQSLITLSSDKQTLYFSDNFGDNEGVRISTEQYEALILKKANYRKEKRKNLPYE